MPRESPCTFEARKTLPTILGNVFYAHAFSRSHIFEPNRSPIAILSCWFDSFNLKFLHGMTFNHWEPNPSCNALNLFTSVGSSRKIKYAISLSKIDPVQFFLDFLFRSHFNFSKFKRPFKRIIIGSIHML